MIGRGLAWPSACGALCPVSWKSRPAAGQLETVALMQRPLHPRSPLGAQLHVDYCGRSVFRCLSFWSALYSLTVVFHLFLQACHPIAVIREHLLHLGKVKSSFLLAYWLMGTREACFSNLDWSAEIDRTSISAVGSSMLLAGMLAPVADLTFWEVALFFPDRAETITALMCTHFTMASNFNTWWFTFEKIFNYILRATLRTSILVSCHTGSPKSSFINAVFKMKIKSNFLPFTLYLVSETDHNRSLKTHVEMPNANVTWRAVPLWIRTPKTHEIQSAV